jgi:hypothetical protein
MTCIVGRDLSSIVKILGAREIVGHKFGLVVRYRVGGGTVTCFDAQTDRA